ncbi:hypothetical protein OH77DRAFT_1592426 [Trametes cingulata]|nr:hypothetical protein OH77DRAFT_1592426 [Trametes cingulata]
MLDAFNIWDIFVGIVGLLTSIPILLHYLKKQLPSRRLRTLFNTLAETDALFTSCIGEGLLKVRQARTFRAQLSRLRGRAEAMRVQVYTARGCGDDFANLLKGMSRRINALRKNVLEVRTKISTTSDRERQARERAAARRRAELLRKSRVGIPDNDEIAAVCWWKPWTFIRFSLCGRSAACDNDRDHDPGAVLHDIIVIPSADAANRSTPVPVVPPFLPPRRDRSSSSTTNIPTSQSRTPTDKSALSMKSSKASADQYSLSSPRRKSRGSPLSRAQALARFVQRNRKQRLKASDQLRLGLISHAAPESIEPWLGDSDWEDIDAGVVQVVV